MLPPLSWRDKVNALVGFCLIKTGRLQYDVFTEQELNALIAPHFPFSDALAVPIGEGQFTCLEAQLSMPTSTNRLTVQILCVIDVRVMGTPIYKAHAAAGISALPNYYPASRSLHLTDTRVDFIHLLNDQYSLVKDTRFIIDKLLPLPLSGLGSLLSQPLRSALSLVSAGSTDQALEYLKLYLHGNTQRILDYHKPRLVTELLATIDERALEYTMADNHWREFLFARYGKRVAVEEKQLRFYFTEQP